MRPDVGMIAPFDRLDSISRYFASILSQIRSIASGLSTALAARHVPPRAPWTVVCVRWDKPGIQTVKKKKRQQRRTCREKDKNG